MIEVSLHLIERATGVELTYEGRELFDEKLVEHRQEELSRLYRQYDVVCSCHADGVRMHVKFRMDTGLYYLADNPTSPAHREGCEFQKSHRFMDEQEKSEMSHDADAWDLPQSYTFFAHASNEGSKSTAKVSRRGQKGAVKPSLFKRLVYTLLDESFSNFYHGSTTTPYTAANTINENEALLQRVQPQSPEELPFKVHYGHRGHMALGKQLLTLAASGVSGFGLWFEKADSWEVRDGEFHYRLDEQWYRCQLACPAPEVDISGPYFIAGLLAPPVGEGRWVELRALLVLPVATRRAMVVVHSESEREFVEAGASEVIKNRHEKLYIGRMLRPWRFDEESMDGPFFIGKRVEPRHRVITLLDDCGISVAERYERRFNASMYAPLQALSLLKGEN
ncbi:hypothetical protein [Aliidiomarina quisquiliarum]|uniref:hypothetical protein n=1 Tax=Aliidiomarina quisquiliarum TaxID=2938947 RepID=UPI00208DEB1F|nr:hypothetical protein [Aliidiomarina quisquiliarum]MCO4320355.1 hypothetical protein [Aliidiomarina quisquiliarum]